MKPCAHKLGPTRPHFQKYNRSHTDICPIRLDTDYWQFKKSTESRKTSFKFENCSEKMFRFTEFLTEKLSKLILHYFSEFLCKIFFFWKIVIQILFYSEFVPAVIRWSSGMFTKEITSPVGTLVWHWNRKVNILKFFLEKFSKPTWTNNFKI
jgi:hypothetical protein